MRRNVSKKHYMYVYINSVISLKKFTDYQMRNAILNIFGIRWFDESNVDDFSSLLSGDKNHASNSSNSQ